MENLFHIFLGGLTLVTTAFAAMSVWVSAPLISKLKFVAVPAFEKTIKIKPINT